MTFTPGYFSKFRENRFVIGNCKWLSVFSFDLSQLTQSLTKIGMARPDREDCRNDGGVEGGEVEELEHDPAEGDHLGHGADFTGPMRIDGDPAIDEIKNPNANDDFDVARDDEDEEPHRETPILAPVHQGQGDEAGEEERFVGEGIEDGTDEGFLIKAASDPAIEPVHRCCDNVSSHREPARCFIGRT